MEEKVSLVTSIRGWQVTVRLERSHGEAEVRLDQRPEALRARCLLPSGHPAWHAVLLAPCMLAGPGLSCYPAPRALAPLKAPV